MKVHGFFHGGFPRGRSGVKVPEAAPPFHPPHNEACPGAAFS